MELNFATEGFCGLNINDSNHIASRRTIRALSSAHWAKFVLNLASPGLFLCHRYQ